MSLNRTVRLTMPLLVVAMFGPPGAIIAFPFQPRPATIKSSRPPAAIPSPPVHGDARVGDWVSYKTAGPNPQTVKKTITTVRADGVTVREERDDKSPAIEYSVAKEGVPAPKAKAGDPQANVEVVGSGKETLTIDGKRYECAWRKTRITFPVTKGKKDDPVVITRTRWVSKDMPLDGEVRSEIEMGGHTVRWELSGFDRGPEEKKP